ncbi:microtubule-associated tumor suppressor candidate 2 [Aplochiton taeniatus]
MSERCPPGGRGEAGNNNEPTGLAPPGGDANANRLQDERLTSRDGEPDRIVIWGTDSQCDDPELAEFEMLEYQELEAYLVEEEEEATVKSTSEEEGKVVALSGSVAKNSDGAEFSSETDVFVSCVSAVSSVGGGLATDTAGKSGTTDSWHVPVTLSEDLTLASESFPAPSDRAQSPAAAGAEERRSVPAAASAPRDVGRNGNATAALSEGGVPEARVVNGEGRREEARNKHNQNNGRNPKPPNTSVTEPEQAGEFKGGAELTVRGCFAEHKKLQMTDRTQEEDSKKRDIGIQADEEPDVNHNSTETSTKGSQSAAEPKTIKKPLSYDKNLNTQNSFERTFNKQNSFEQALKKQPSFDRTLRKQGSFETPRSSSPSSLERRKPWGSPSRPATPPSPKTTWSPKKRPVSSPGLVQSSRAPSQERSGSPQRSPASGLKLPTKVCLSAMGVPKTCPPPQKDPADIRRSPPRKPKNIRPKIITYVRKGPQGKPEDSCEAPAAPPRLGSYPSPPAHQTEQKAGHQAKGTAGLASSNLLFDKYRQEMQRAGYYPPGPPGSGIKPQKFSGKPESYQGEQNDRNLHEEAAGLYRSPRALRPQLGLGAVGRQPPSKVRVPQAGQRSTPTLTQQGQAAGGATQGYEDPTAEQRRAGPEPSPKPLLTKAGATGLRPPGFAALPPTRLAAFGFVRSASVSSVSSGLSCESGHSDACRPSHRPGSSADDAPFPRTTAPPGDAGRPANRSVPQPPSAPPPQRRSLLPPARGASPVVRAGRCLAAGSRAGGDSDRALVQKLRERCEFQERQLHNLEAQLKRATLGLDVFAITTQHFRHKSDSAIVKERELSLELARIRDEVAFSVARWERLQRDKEELERRFESDLQGLRRQQRSELGALEERLRAQHQAQTLQLEKQQHAELEELRTQQQEQMSEMSESQEEALSEMEKAHGDTLATLREEHARTVKNLKMAHEQQKKSLEEDFEKLRLSLQDQVDTLTFQNRSLRDRAKRFEEALLRSTDEQIVDALAPYQHIEEDLKSLKEVLEMKNQQIHQQESKISELEIMAQKNVYLEERVQVLQQQNEDLKARIDNNLAMSRQLSEENANLQVNVEKESNEKKRLSRTNEELLWRLQTGELSPRMSPAGSPLHRPSPGPFSVPCSPARGPTARPHSYHQ